LLLIGEIRRQDAAREGGLKWRMEKVGRNDPCPCGSGKKYKQCCRDSDLSPVHANPSVTALSAADLKQLALLFNARRYADMELFAHTLVGKFPDSGAAWKALGTARQMQRKNAIEQLQGAAQRLPNDPEVFNNLAAALLDQKRAEDAALAAGRAIALKADFAEAWANLGKAMRLQGRTEEAVANYRRALDIKPAFATAHSSLGIALDEQGDFAAAAASFESAISIDPGLIEAHYGLSQLKTYRNGDPHLGMLEQQIGRIESSTLDNQMRFWFALGKVCEDLGNYDNAFAAYRAGNHVKRTALGAKSAHEEANAEANEQALLARIVATFTPDMFAQRDRAEPMSEPGRRTPIFIVGMPRSGSTLLEQILASCPDVHGAGELPYVSTVAEETFRLQGQPFPLCVPDLSPEDLHRMGSRYAELVSAHAPDVRYVTDKMPANFFYIGLIRLMLPHAKIIHAMRDPMDSCFSCYARLFADDEQAFSYDLGSLGRYYVRYAELMKHWHAVLPAGSILDVRYEDLVADAGKEARRVLDYLDLPWNEACLDFHRNKRRVRTASAAQVQKPIYRSSVARWTHFARHLGVLSSLLQPQDH
jgi:tetratricopeptide (TPR) repeat protein